MSGAVIRDGDIACYPFHQKFDSQLVRKLSGTAGVPVEDNHAAYLDNLRGASSLSVDRLNWKPLLFFIGNGFNQICPANGA